MKTVRPKPLGGEIAALRLTPEEGFVLSRIDGRLSVRDLVALTGLEEGRVEQIVTKLAGSGAIALEAGDSSGYLPDVESTRSPRTEGQSGAHASLADFAAALGMDPTAFAASRSTAAVEAPIAEHLVDTRATAPDGDLEDAATAHAHDAGLEEAGDHAGAVLEEATDEHVPDAPDTTPDLQSLDADAIPELIPLGDTDDAETETAELVPLDEATAEALTADGGDAEPSGEDAADEPHAIETDERVANERSYRELYEAKYHALPLDARVALAGRAHGPDLFALCFDAEPRVIAAILENAAVTLDHVRLIALHHRTATGLEIVSRRQDWLRDGLVERRLLKNPQCSEAVFSRILAPKPIHFAYKVAIDREVPELTRVKGRGAVRSKWQRSRPDERADFILRTGARCLALMTGCTFDAKTTQILCGRPYNDVLMIQNFAKFGATPPGLLAHLAKQPFVRKNAPLRKLLLAHPNLPGDVKRSL